MTAVVVNARPRRAGLGGIAVTVVLALLAGMIALLLLNTALAQGSFALQRLQSKATALDEAEQSLIREVATGQAPETLQAAATRMGMVPVAAPVFLRLSDGQVLGDPVPARAQPQAPTGINGALSPKPRTSSATTKPATTKPATAKPTTTKPTTTKPVTTKPVTTKPVTTKPVTTKPATTKPTTTKTVAR